MLVSNVVESTRIVLQRVKSKSSSTFFGNDITLGAGYSWGKDRVLENKNIETSTGSAEVPFADFDATIEYRQWKFIVGFAFGAGDNRSDS